VPGWAYKDGRAFMELPAHDLASSASLPAQQQFYQVSGAHVPDRDLYGIIFMAYLFGLFSCSSISQSAKKGDCLIRLIVMFISGSWH
jgi:hypothetical protein